MAGRVLSSRNESLLREASAALTEVLAQLGEEQNAVRSAPGIETRGAPIQGVEIREINGRPVITGHAAVFHRLSVELYGFRERIAPGAFAESLSGDVRALWQHDSARVLGRTRSGTLRLAEDARGLAFELEPPDTADGRDALTLIARGDVDQMSFGFNVPDGGDSWEQEPGGLPIRTLTRVNLIEISPVTFPAYPDTSAAVLRGAPDWVQRALLPAGVDHTLVTAQARARLALLKQRLQLHKDGRR